MNELYLTPKDGVTVRDPVSGLALPATGAAKPRTAYWLRRLRDGDVSASQPPKATATSFPEAQKLAAAEAALKSAERAIETAASTAAQTAAQTATSTKGAAK